MRKLYNEYKFTLFSFLIWRVTLFSIIYLALKYVPLQNNFLGGGKSNYLQNPYLWSFANFDGEHYLSIAQSGYKSLQYFYFPLFPIATSFFSGLFNRSIQNIVFIGQFISNLAFFISLIGIWKLVKIDYSSKIAKICIILLLVFPTSFYFASFYTESLFLMFVVWSFYFARRKKWFFAAILGGLSSATRSTGVFLFPALFVEYLLNEKNKKLSTVITLFLIPLGLIFYMLYLKNKTGDFFAFNYSGYIFGEYRSAKPIPLPQVFYRYIFKIIPNLNLKYFTGTFPILFEFLTAITLTLVSLFSITKMRLSYWVYMVAGFVTPTLYLSFVSLPRYILVLFPTFIFLSVYISKLPKILQMSIFALLFAGLIISLSLFSRGFWIA
ncbi:glycosyltransferase family 39 protein [Candidatus Microgenomates bacterium]|nr:glycosyltransferase family 39 protein [Candidatus Microgenomates bacterium]